MTVLGHKKKYSQFIKNQKNMPDDGRSSFYHTATSYTIVENLGHHAQALLHPKQNLTVF
jgi:hypothetical protein